MTLLDPVADTPDGHRALRRVFGRFPSGVVALCARPGGGVGGRPVGMAVSSYTSLSLDPPLVLACVDRASTTWPVLREHAASGRLGVSVLGEAHAAAARRLSSRTGDRFAGLDLVDGDGGALFVDGAAAWLECSVDGELPGGDHVVVLLRIHGHRGYDGGPLVFHAGGFTSVAAGDHA